MAKQLGNARKCYIGDGSGSWLTGEQSNSVNVNGNLVETSDKSNAWQSFIQGIKGATATVTVHADAADATQTALLTALTAGTTVHVFIGNPASGSGASAVAANGYAFDALVANIDETNDNGAVATRTINLTATGAVTVGTIS